MAERDRDIDHLFEPGAEAELNTYLRLLHPADIAELFSLIDPDQWRAAAAHLDAATLAELLTHLDDWQRAELGEMLGVERLIHAVDELETDDAADVIADLPEEKSEVVLAALEDRDEIESLLAYPDDSAGGIMQTELCVVTSGTIVRDAIEAVRAAREEIDDILELYVVDAAGHLVGTAALEDLVLSKGTTPIEQITRAIEAHATPTMDQEEAAHLFGKYGLVTLPVTSPDGVLLGRITFDDIHEVLEEEASEDLMAIAGASPEELFYGPDFVRIAFMRLPWLASSLAGSLVTGFLLTLLGKVGTDAIILASFVPVVMAMTGNVGSQTAMIVTRGFALGRIDMSAIGRTFFREVRVGLVMGVSAGVIVALIAELWRGNVALGVTVGLSMTLSMTVAAVAGVAAPALFKLIGVDPAIAAGPMVTTGSDILAVSTYLTVAMLNLS